MLVRWLRGRRRQLLHPLAWIADEEDQAAIGDPLARMAARHAPISGEGAGDMVDGLEAMLGTANYAMKGVQLEGVPFDAAEQEAPPGGA